MVSSFGAFELWWWTCKDVSSKKMDEGGREVLEDMHTKGDSYMAGKLGEMYKLCKQVVIY